MAQLLDIFKLQHLVVSITALWQDSAFFKFISKEKKQFKTFLPTKSTITSETIITANINDFFPFFDLLLESDPRNITLYGLKEDIVIDNSNYKELYNDDDTLIKKGVINYAIAIILEECCIKITFNSSLYNPSNLFKTIKKEIKRP